MSLPKSKREVTQTLATNYWTFKTIKVWEFKSFLVPMYNQLGIEPLLSIVKYWGVDVVLLDIEEGKFLDRSFLCKVLFTFKEEKWKKLVTTAENMQI